MVQVFHWRNGWLSRSSSGPRRAASTGFIVPPPWIARFFARGVSHCKMDSNDRHSLLFMVAAGAAAAPDRAAGPPEGRGCGGAYDGRGVADRRRPRGDAALPQGPGDEPEAEAAGLVRVPPALGAAGRER